MTREEVIRLLQESARPPEEPEPLPAQQEARMKQAILAKLDLPPLPEPEPPVRKGLPRPVKIAIAIAVLLIAAVLLALLARGPTHWKMEEPPPIGPSVGRD